MSLLQENNAVDKNDLPKGNHLQDSLTSALDAAGSLLHEEDLAVWVARRPGPELEEGRAG